MPTAPTPLHLLRAHHAPLSALHFNHSNTLLYSGDQDGYIAILDLSVRRVVTYWKAHEGGVLGLEEWEGKLISHGRDNVIHIYEPLKPPYISFGLPTTGQKGTPLTVAKSLPTNALNFCRFSLAPLPSAHEAQFTVHGEASRGKGKEKEALLAVPGLTDSELVDIYHLPSLRRMHASVNLPSKLDQNGFHRSSPINGETSRSGLVMSLHLSVLADSSRLALAVGYEDGRVELYTAPLSSASRQWDARMSTGSAVWEKLWSGKGHNEAVMAMAVDRNMTRGFSVSADHRLVRYDFRKVLSGGVNRDDKHTISDSSTKQIGNSSLAISGDGLVVAAGGWDGRIRLFSTATFKPLGTLVTHRETVHVLAFASPRLVSSLSRLEAETAALEENSTVDINDEDSELDVDDDEEDDDGSPPRERWLASGGKDTKVALWGLMDFRSQPAQ